MDIIKTVKDCIDISQKVKNYSMTQNLIDIQKEVLNMQQEMYNLQKENKELKDSISNQKDIKRYRNIPAITIDRDNNKILYCATCYGNEKKLIQLNVVNFEDSLCPNCKTHCYLHYSPDYELIKDDLKC